jgi:chromosome segregation ATPase
MKFPKLSALFGAAVNWFQGGPEGKGLTPEQQASLEASEKKLGDMEAEIGQLKAEKESHVTKVTELNARVTELTTQVTTLTSEKATLVTEKAALQTKLDATPTGTATTVIPNGSQEASQAADTNQPKAANKYTTSVDAELAEMKKNSEQLTFK